MAHRPTWQDRKGTWHFACGTTVEDAPTRQDAIKAHALFCRQHQASAARRQAQAAAALASATSPDRAAQG